MTDNEKTIGEPIDDEELKNVSGGLYIPDIDRGSLNELERPAKSGNLTLETLNIHIPTKPLDEYTVTIGEEDENHAQKMMQEQLRRKDN